MKYFKLKEISEIKNGEQCNYSDKGIIPVYGSNGIIGYTDDLNAPENSIIIGRVGANAGSVFYSLKKHWVSDNAISVVPNVNKVNPFYLYYVLFNLDLNRLVEGSAQPLINQSILNSFEISVPSLSVQTSVIEKIRVFDEKIAINNQINDNLMELKTTIFNKMFSINLTNCLNGKIKDIAEVRTGKRPKIKYSKKGSTPIYPIIGASKIMGYTDEYLYNKSIITTGRVGTLGIVKRYREPVWVSDNSFIFITKYEDYLYELLTHFINYSALNIGSTQPLITQTEFRNVDIYIPKREELIEFKEKVVTLTEQQFELRQQNRLLNDLKSYLLSKLF
ncbi:restriction endonuclease subunit S [Bombilactobacillus mellis]|uniref:restriction endonuclease subunit S n=1 Tax=Bombilactobacillus mellis TaxID=1218508 RepID=UPI0022479468|nr:restriction endonuclease subunit S [Bombilactobacillus mellis]MCX0278453.1 restriction endonuclease subunit S [Bombilactobacillus mellis]